MNLRDGIKHCRVCGEFIHMQLQMLTLFYTCFSYLYVCTYIFITNVLFLLLIYYNTLMAAARKQ